VTDRDKEITRRVLMGETIKLLAKEFEITVARVRQIIAKTCKRKNEALFISQPGYKVKNYSSESAFDLRWLRERRQFFIDGSDEH